MGPSAGSRAALTLPSPVEVLEHELGVPVHDPSGWNAYGDEWADLLPIWGRQAQWDIRQRPSHYRVWATLWNTDALWVSAIAMPRGR